MTCHHAQLVYVDAKRAFIEQNKSFLLNASNPQKLWSKVRIAVFGKSSSLQSLVGKRSRLV